MFDLLRPSEIIATPQPGAVLEKCIKEAARIAKANKCWIRFKHNGISYVADDEGNCAKDKSPLT